MGLYWHHGRKVAILSISAVFAAAMMCGGVLRAQADGELTGSSGSEFSAPATSAVPVIRTMTLVDAPLASAVDIIQQKTGIQVVIKPQVDGQPYGKVNVSLRNQSVSTVLKAIAESANADMWQQDGIYYIGPHGSAPQPPAPQPTVLPEQAYLPPASNYHIVKIRLKYLPPDQFLRMIHVDSRPDVSHMIQQASLAAMEQSITGGNYIPASSQAPVFLTPGGAQRLNPQAQFNGYGGAAGAAPSSQGNMFTQVSPSSQDTSGAAAGAAASAVNFPASGGQAARRSDSLSAGEFGRGQGFGGFGGPGGQGGFNGGPGGGGFGAPGGGAGGPGGGSGVGGPGGANGNNATAQALLPPGIDPNDIMALDADGSLLLRYQNPEQLNQFKELVRLLDVEPRQILIKAQFVTVTHNDVNSFGITWNFTRVNLVAAANAGFSPTNTASIQYATGNLQTQLSWILTTGRGKLITSPESVTLNGIPAIFTDTTEVPILVQQPIIGINGNVFVSTTITELPVTVYLGITPYINGDGSIYLTGNLFSFDIQGTITNPAGGSIPIIAGQQAIVTRIVGNGDTLVINGLTRKQDSISENKIPLLGDLPLIGTLFRSRNVTTNDADLLVFITPQILPNPVPAAEVPQASSNNGSAGLLP